MVDLKCPECDGKKLEKYGRTPFGVQKYRCLDPHCGRQFRAEGSRRIDLKTKGIVIRLLNHKISPSMIHKAVPGISLRSIYEMRRGMK